MSEDSTNAIMCHLFPLQKSMETVKQFNAKRSGEGVLLGETSRSDFLDGEGVSHVTIPQWDGTQPESRLRDVKFPQPKLAQSHTESNVCAAPCDVSLESSEAHLF